MMLPRHNRLFAALTVLALMAAGCSADCVSCGSRGPTANLQSAAFNLCLSEVPNADEAIRECTIVNLEFVIVD